MKFDHQDSCMYIYEDTWLDDISRQRFFFFPVFLNFLSLGLIKFRELLENDSEFERRLAVGDDTSEKIAASVLCFLCQQDGFSEKNMVVSSEKLNFLQGIILSKWNSASAFPRRCIRKCIPALLERIHEAKLRETSSECILSLAGFTAPRFIFSMWQTVLHNSKYFFFFFTSFFSTS